jgi:cytochrome c556
MTHRRNSYRLLLMLSVLMTAVSTTVLADDDDVITYRQLVMKEMDAESSALGMMVSGQIPPDALASQARALAFSTKASLKAFEPKVPGGEAKADVWAKWDDFAKRLQLLVQKTDEMAKVAESGNLAAFSEKMTDALTCKQCHDIYRNKKS